MKNIIILIIIAVVVGGTALYGLLFHTTPENIPDDIPTPVVTEEKKMSDEPFNGTDTLQGLMALNRDLECVITYVPNEYESAVTGTYFVSNGSVRGDFLLRSTELGGQVLSSIIIAENTFYSWSTINGESYGVKVDMTLFDSAAVEGVKEPVPQDATIEYTCKAWELVDGSVFVPPRDVLFQDYAAVMQTGMEYGTIYNEAN